MESFFNKNIAAARLRWPDMETLSQSLPAGIEVLPSHSGNVTIRYRNLLIHSAYDPVAEAKKFAQDILPGSFVCLYGFGLGYHIQAVLEKMGAEGRLLVIELNPDFLSAAMILRNQTNVFSDPRLQLIFGREEAAVSKKISEQMDTRTLESNSPPEVLFHAPSFKSIPDRFPCLTNALEILLMERRFPAVLGDLESQNYVSNREAIGQVPGINALAGSHCGQPGFLVGAGPSLDDVLPHLHRMETSAVIGCVDTALPVLTRHGISPHYVFTLDPQEESFRYFRGHLDGIGKLIFTPTAHPKIVSCFRGKKYVVFKEGHSLYQHQAREMKEKGSTRAGGSVSCLGLDSLIQLGCNPVYLVGQDCAFSGGRTYAADSDRNRQLLDLIPHIHDLAGMHVEQKALNKQIRIMGTSGSMVATCQSMFNYKQTIEQIALQYPKTRLYNLISHGAQLENIDALGSVRELVELTTQLQSAV